MKIQFFPTSFRKVNRTSPFIEGGIPIGLPYLIWLGNASKELIPANKERVLESLLAGDILFNDHVYLLAEKRWTPIFKLEEFEKHSFPFHEETPVMPDWHPPPLPKVSLMSKAQREDVVSLPRPAVESGSMQFDLLMEKLTSLESKISSGNSDFGNEIETLSKEFEKLSDHDQNKWLVLEKRMNWFDEKLSEYTERKSLKESVEKEKSLILKQQIKHSENKVQEVESRYYKLEQNYQNALKEINIQERELSRLAAVEKDLKTAQEKAHFFLEELSEVKYKMKQRESLHQDHFIKETFEKLFKEVDEKISLKIDEASKLNGEASASVEDFHQAIIDLKEGQSSKDEKFDSIVDLISKQSKVVSGLLERREALDKRIVEKVEDGVTGLSVEQKELARKIQMVIEDFKDLERTITLSQVKDGQKGHIEIVKKWQDHSSSLEQEIKVLNEKLISEMAKTSVSGESNLDYEKFLIEKQNSDKKIESLTKVSRTQEVKIEKLTGQNTKLKSKLKEVSDKYNVLLAKYKKVDSSTSDAEEIKVQFEEEQEKTRNMKLDLDNLKAELEKLNNDYEELKTEKSAVEEEHTKAHILIQELEVYKQAAKEQAKKEFKRLTGESFEVPNDETWWVKIGDVVTGPHRFGELYEKKENGDLDRDQTYLKSEEQGKWTPMGKFTEFNVPVQVHTIEEDGHEVTKYFIRRGSFRAPFYEIVTLELGDNEYRGYCTSLSQGGIFIEFNKIDPDEMYKEAMGTVFFKKGALKRAFSCEVKIMNIADKRPRGLGMMFINLGESDKQLVQEYVNQYMDQSKNKKAA